MWNDYLVDIHKKRLDLDEFMVRDNSCRSTIFAIWQKSSSKEKGEIRIISKLSTIRMLVFHMKIIIRLSVKHVI